MVEIMTKGVLEWSRAGDQIDSKLGENEKNKTVNRALESICVKITNNITKSMASKA